MPPRKRGLSPTHFIFLLSLAVVIASFALVFHAYGFLGREFPNTSILKSRYPVVEVQADGRPRIRWSSKRPANWVDLGSISRVAVGAVIVSEDWAYYQHSGYDAAQIKEAIVESLESGSLGRGASTITQQVTRNLFLSQERSLWRKFKELILAIRLEREVGKKRILEAYFNIAEWGDRIYGIGQASWHYFAKAPSELSAKEGAFLAMLLPSPKRYSQSFRNRQLTPFAQRTIRQILNKMVLAKYLEPEERDLEHVRRLSFERDPEPSETLPDEPAESDDEILPVLTHEDSMPQTDE